MLISQERNTIRIIAMIFLYGMLVLVIFYSELMVMHATIKTIIVVLLFTRPGIPMIYPCSQVFTYSALLLIKLFLPGTPFLAIVTQ